MRSETFYPVCCDIADDAPGCAFVQLADWGCRDQLGLHVRVDHLSGFYEGLYKGSIGAVGFYEGSYGIRQNIKLPS